MYFINKSITMIILKKLILLILPKKMQNLLTDVVKQVKQYFLAILFMIKREL